MSPVVAVLENVFMVALVVAILGLLVIQLVLILILIMGQEEVKPKAERVLSCHLMLHQG